MCTTKDHNGCVVGSIFHQHSRPSIHGAQMMNPIVCRTFSVVKGSTFAVLSIFLRKTFANYYIL